MRTKKYFRAHENFPPSEQRSEALLAGWDCCIESYPLFRVLRHRTLSFTNVLIETEAGYLTPARPLLKGTQREGLLRTGLIAEADDLTLSTLRSKAKAILLINALLPLEEALRLPPEALQD